MSPAFAAQDIASLLTSFPPPKPSRDQPSLVRTLSGNNLVDSQKVVSLLQSLLDSREAGARVALKQVPSLSRVKSPHQIISTYAGILYFSYDRQSVVSPKEFDKFIEDLASAAAQKFIELSSFAKQRDISINPLDEETSERITKGLCAVQELSGPRHYVVTNELYNITQQSIQDLLDRNESVVVDLGQHLPGVPWAVIRSLFSQVSGRGSPRGEIEERDGKLVFEPKVSRDERRRLAHERKLETNMLHLDRSGFADIPNGIDGEQLHADTMKAYGERLEGTNMTLVALDIEDGYRAIVVDVTMREILEEIRSKIRPLARSYRGRTPFKLTDDVRTQLRSGSRLPALVDFLLKSQYRFEIEGMAAAAIEQLREEKHDQFTQLFQFTVMAPVQLYALATYNDATLKQHQEAYLGQFICSEIVSDLTNKAKHMGFIGEEASTASKFLQKDIEKFLEACDASKTSAPKSLTEAQVAIAKLAKKQKIAAPDATQVNEVKQKNLRERCRAIKKVIRGSDVLQNLIWILLGQASEGLYVSSGKDTSRMIEQYKLIGEVVIWEKLLKWRDLLKSGEARKEDVESMKDLASETLPTVSTGSSGDEESTAEAS